MVHRIGTAVWAVWTWSYQLDEQKKTERARLATLYINPFLSACEDLQSRIYSILGLDGHLNRLQPRRQPLHSTSFKNLHKTRAPNMNRLFYTRTDEGLHELPLK